jgi:hypothetical protein
MVEVFHTAEDLESLDNLHALCSLMQTIRKFLPFPSPSPVFCLALLLSDGALINVCLP